MTISRYPRLPEAPEDFTPVQKRQWNELVRILENFFRDQRNEFREDSIEERARTVKEAITLGDDAVILADTAAASFIITLPFAENKKNFIYYVKNIGTTGNSVTVQAKGAQLIDGSSTQVIGNYDTMKIVSDGSNWWII